MRMMTNRIEKERQLLHRPHKHCPGCTRVPKEDLLAEVSESRIRELVSAATAKPAVGPTDPEYWKAAVDNMSPKEFDRLFDQEDE